MPKKFALLRTCRNYLRVSCSAIAILAALSPTIVLAEEGARTFDISGQSVSSALTEFAVDSDLEILFAPDVVSGKQTKGVKGDYTPEKALEIILDETGLGFERDPEGTLVVRRVSMADNIQLAQAQTTTGSRSDAEDEPPENVDELIVTGTNIRGELPTSTIITFDREQIELGGFTNVDDLLRVIPQNFADETGTTTFGNAAAGNFAFGTGVNLRGLGAGSTLTLVNGRRVSPAGGDVGGFVDVSGLPLAAIDRVEILPDGASAIYGSDAVAGVVNFILRKDYEGAETQLRYGLGSRGSDDIFASQVAGYSWNSGRILGTLEYRHTDAVELAEFGVTSLDLRPLGGDDFRPPFIDLTTGAFSPAPNVVLPLAGPFLTDTFSPFALIPAGQDGTSLTLADIIPVFDPSVVPPTDAVPVDLSPEAEQFSAFISLEQDITKNVKVFFDGLYAYRENEFRNFRPTSFISVSPLNPFTPFSEPVAVLYQPLAEFGPALNEAKTQNIALNAGAEGEFFENWRWQLIGTYSKDEGESGIHNLFMQNPFIVSSFVDNPDPSVAFNPFGDGSAQNPDTVNALLDRNVIETNTDLWGISLKVDGELWDLPGGAVKVAFGGEYREEAIDDALDLGSTEALLPPGFDPSFFDPNATAERDVWAVFVEALFPIIGKQNNIPGVQSLDLSVAGRYEDYSDFGSAANPKIGVAWSPMEDVTIRGSWGTSFKAPLLRDLFGIANLQSGFPVLDPNAPGGPAFVLIDLFEGGNPNLKEEEGSSYNIGIDFTPSAVPNFQVTVTYFNIEFRDRIRGIFDGLNIDFLLANENLLPPGIIIRDGGGNLLSVSTANINSAVTEISGFDFSTSYSHQFDFGTISGSFGGSYFNKYDEAIFDGSSTLELLDTIGNPVDFRARGSLSWSHQGFTAATFVNYTDGYTNNSPDPLGVAQNQKIDSYTTVDFQLSYEVDSSGPLNGTSFRVGATNVFDTEPPFVNASNRLGLDAERIIPRGRVVYFELTKAFGAFGD